MLPFSQGIILLLIWVPITDYLFKHFLLVCLIAEELAWWICRVISVPLLLLCVPLNANMLHAFAAWVKPYSKCWLQVHLKKWVLFTSTKNKVTCTETYRRGWQHVQKLWILNIRDSASFLSKSHLLYVRVNFLVGMSTESPWVCSLTSKSGDVSLNALATALMAVRKALFHFSQAHSFFINIWYHRKDQAV